MPNVGMNGPYGLTPQNAAAFAKKPGAYALGSVNANGGLSVSYIGRADVDLSARLAQHAATGKYAAFKADNFPTMLAAFQKECELFHNFGETALDNKVHPARPAGTTHTCIYCTALD